MARVRCAGWGNQPVTSRSAKARFARRGSCGWESERPGQPTKIDGEIHWNILTIPDDPCPRCGGPVELAP